MASPYDRPVIGSGITLTRRVLHGLGYELNGELLCFGAVPIVCLALSPLLVVGGPRIPAGVLILLCGCTAGVVAVRRGYSRPRTAWYGFCGIIALFGWSIFLGWLLSAAELI